MKCTPQQLKDIKNNIRSKQIDKACAICKRLQSTHPVKMSDEAIREHFESMDMIALEDYLDSRKY